MGRIREQVQHNLGYFLSLRQITQKDLAEALGVSQSAVTNWIKGKNSPDIETVAKICTILKISVVELFGISEGICVTDREEILIQRYRECTEMQPAIDRLLGLSPQSENDETKSSR